MGAWWEWFTGRAARRRGEELARRKFPAVKGLSPETAEAVVAGEVELVDAEDHPQVEKLAPPPDPV